MKKIEIYFGVGKDRDGRVLDSALVERALDAIRDRAARIFGGCTLLRTQGDWVSNRLGMVVTEPGAMLILLTDSATHPAGVAPIADFIKGILNQESVYVVTSEVVAELL